MKNKRTILLLVTVFVLLVGLFLLVLAKNRQGGMDDPAGRLKIKGYVQAGDAACAALMPTCGYCPGEVIHSSCYVTKAQFDEYKERYPDLEAN